MNEDNSLLKLGKGEKYRTSVIGRVLIWDFFGLVWFSLVSKMLTLECNPDRTGLSSFQFISCFYIMNHSDK